MTSCMSTQINNSTTFFSSTSVKVINTCCLPYAMSTLSPVLCSSFSILLCPIVMGLSLSAGPRAVPYSTWLLINLDTKRCCFLFSFLTDSRVMWHAIQVVEPAVQPSTDPHLPQPKGACHPREACLQWGACLLLQEGTPPPEISGCPQWGGCHPLPTLQVKTLLLPDSPFL